MSRCLIKYAGYLILTGLFFFGLPTKGETQDAKQHLLWQIGKPDNNISEFALASDGWKDFAKDGFFIIGRSNEKSDWPYCHPGPDDEWAGNKQHTFSILFGIRNVFKSGNCKLKFKIIDIGNVEVKLNIKVNGQDYKSTLPKGAGKAINSEVEKEKKYEFETVIPTNILRAGNNAVSITTETGSWFIYDWVGFEVPAGIHSEPVNSSIFLINIEGLPFISTKEGQNYQSAKLSLVNPGISASVKVKIQGLSPQQFSINTGNQQVEILAPEVTKDSSIEVAIERNQKVIGKKIFIVKPVTKMTIYILPHSHNDIGYTEIQTNIEKKQINNLLKGIEYAQKTKDYPEGSRFVWNLEGLYAADLYLQRMNEQQKNDFYKAVKDGGVALNGMYFNVLSGLCRPDELLQLFKFSTSLAQKCQVNIDAAMISDVPGYNTWGTVTAMAHYGIARTAIRK